ncbi:MAG: AMP-binding protein [Muribaculaceae bacterium]|nr:AMP-binding protein [Muribaculaceae bacterium]
MKHLTQQEQFSRAKEIFSIARKSPYYSEKYKNISKVETDADWQAIPALSRNDLYYNTYPATHSMFTAPLADAIVLSTGGSSGVARTVVLSNGEWDDFCEKQAEAFKLLDVKPDDIVANLFIAGHLWPSFIGVHEMVKRVNAVQLPISSNIVPEEIYAMCKQYQPTVMVSLPTLFVFLADLAKKDNYKFTSLRLIAYAGEQLSREAEAHVKKYLGVKEIKALAYSSSDCGIMGYQCPHCGFGTYHLPSDFQKIEIVDSETLLPVADGEAGEILITNLRREFQPIVRYRIGDMATILKESCPCGDKNPLFRLSGRAGEDFKLGGAYVSIDVFEKAVNEYSDYLSMNFQLILEDVGNQMLVDVNVECDNKEKNKGVSIELKQRLEELIPELKVGQELNFIKHFAVNLIELGALPRNPITGKIKKIVDKRVI